ncbi:MAG TPA: pitrilysin family protein [Dissulfurispiraceae bacterium]|nr:pitrilysin family protein [Dissulfurispiraceae bacterium]
MKKNCLFWIAVFLLSAVMPVAGAAPLQEFALQNGLKVFIIEDHKAPLATFQIWYRVGSLDEPCGKSGMSHLLEHMMFKGTPKYGSKVFSNIIQRNGGTDNAFTTKDYTMYFQTIAADRISLSIALESDRMRNLLLDPKETLSERDVVMEERRMRYDNEPQSLLYEETVATVFQAHPYRNPVIGWMSDIMHISRDDLAAHYKKFYAPDNAFIMIAGDVEPAKIMAEVKQAFGKIPAYGKRERRYVTEEPPQTGQRRFVLKKEAELPAVILAFPVPSLPHEDSYALEVLSSILSGGKSSRLYRSLVYEKRIALEASADYSGLNRYPYVFTLDAVATPGIEAAAVEKALFAEIERVQQEPPSEREVEKVKNHIESSFVFAQDSTYSQALYRGMFEVIGGWRLLDKYLEGVRSVTPEMVRTVARKYLVVDHSTVGILVPLKKENEQAAKTSN